MTTTPAPARLRAVTREVDPADDRARRARRRRVRVAAPPDADRGTSGVAARLAPDDVDAALAAIDADDPLGLPGTGALAVGALPFDPAAAGELVIPARVVRASSTAARWITEIGTAGAEPRLDRRRRRPGSRSWRRDRASEWDAAVERRARRDRRAATSRRSCSRARC